MSEANVDARILPVRPGVGLAVVLLAAGILAVLTARECHHNLELHGLHAPFAPSLLYGCVTWVWWVLFTVVLWNLAERWPTVLKPSARTIVAHLGISCLLATAHLSLLQCTIWFASSHWTVWGRHYITYGVEDIERFGGEIVLYGFIYGICASLYSRMQTQHALVQKLEVEQQLTQAQLKALQMQMEPHFLFNTLNAITSLVAQGRNQEAMKTLAHLNTILRTTLARKAPEKVPFAEELRVIESYLAIQQVRFSGRLQVKIEASEEALDGLIPCFLLQPIVENAIQHGIALKAAGGLIETNVKRVGGTLWMQVRDNGRGSGASGTKGHGIGMQNTRERLAYFYPDAHEFHAMAPADGGYEVTIQIPYERALA
jgi:two-component system, LytTR family, sensor kinase